MASTRIKKETAELVAIPPTEWSVKSIQWLLETDTIKNNIHNVGLNEPLVESLKRDGMISPILTMPSYYPIVGSQRIRAFQHIKEETPDHSSLLQDIRVARFEKEYWNMFYLWKSEDNFQNKAIAVWFQTVELAWKSIHYIDSKDSQGNAMTLFEDIGDKTKWNISEEDRRKYAF